MPDYSLSDLKDYAVTLDVLQRMGDAAADAGFDATFSMWPGQPPVVRLKGLRVPLGVPGIGDPVGSVVPAGSIDILSMPSDFKHPDAVRTSSPVPAEDGLLIAVPDGQAVKPPQPAPSVRKPVSRADAWSAQDDATLIEGVAQDMLAGRKMFDGATRMAPILGRPVQGTVFRAKTKLRDRINARVAEIKAQEKTEMLGGEPGGLQRHLPAENAPVQGVAGACDGVAAAAPEAQPVAEVPSRPEPWTDAEVAEVVEAIAQAKVSGDRGARTRALDDVSSRLGRGRAATELITRTQAKDRIAARIAELTAQQDGDASTQGSSPALEQAGAVAAVSQPLPVAQSAHVPAPADDTPADAAQVVELVPEQIAPPAAPAVILPRLPNDALTDHLLRPMTRRGRRLADDLALVEMLTAKMPTGMIATELAMQPHEVTACYDRLTGYNIQTKARSYGLPEVEARLRILVAHHDQQSAA